MQSREQRASEIMNSIREILLRDWDPIGIADDEEWPRDEYDAYVGQIYSFLIRNEPADFIARHLCFVEGSMMGLGAPPVSTRMPIALKLKALNVSLTA